MNKIPLEELRENIENVFSELKIKSIKLEKELSNKENGDLFIYGELTALNYCLEFLSAVIMQDYSLNLHNRNVENKSIEIIKKTKNIDDFDQDFGVFLNMNKMLILLTNIVDKRVKYYLNNGKIEPQGYCFSTFHYTGNNVAAEFNEMLDEFKEGVFKMLEDNEMIFE